MSPSGCGRQPTRSNNGKEISLRPIALLENPPALDVGYEAGFVGKHFFAFFDAGLLIWLAARAAALWRVTDGRAFLGDDLTRPSGAPPRGFLAGCRRCRDPLGLFDNHWFSGGRCRRDRLGGSGRCDGRGGHENRWRNWSRWGRSGDGCHRRHSNGRRLNLRRLRTRR